MRNLRKPLIAMVVLATVGFFVPACKKVSPKKLDGNWKMTNGVVVETINPYYIYDSNGEWIKSTLTATTTSDGKNYKTIYSPKKIETMTGPHTMSMKFNKETGEYSKTNYYQSTDIITYLSYAIDHNGIKYDYRETMETKVSNITEYETGVFTITGGTGDIAKNSEIVLRRNTLKETINENFSYNEYTYDNGQFVAGKMIPHSGRLRTDGGPLLPNNAIVTTDTGENLNQKIYSVKELNGGKLEITATTKSSKISDLTTTETTYSETWNLEKEQ